jgi:hypothetical protein
MSARITHSILIFAVAAALSACQWPGKKKVPKATPIRFPTADSPGAAKHSKPRQIGTILMFNAEGNFVLIDSAGWIPPPKGTALKCFRDGKETGIIAVGAERSGTHVAADVVSGEPRKGDQVFQ